MRGRNTQASGHSAKNQIQRSGPLRKEFDSEVLLSSFEELSIEQSQVKISSHYDRGGKVTSERIQISEHPSTRSKPISMKPSNRTSFQSQKYSSYFNPPLNPEGTVLDMSDRPLLQIFSSHQGEVLFCGADHSLYSLNLLALNSHSSSSPSSTPIEQIPSISHLRQRNSLRTPPPPSSSANSPSSSSSSLYLSMHPNSSGHSEWVTGGAVLKDGRALSVGMDGKLCLWSRDRRSSVDVVGAHGGHPISRILSLSNPYSSSSSSSSASYYQWELYNTGFFPRREEGEEGGENEREERVFTCGYDGNIVLWRIPPLLSPSSSSSIHIRSSSVSSRSSSSISSSSSSSSSIPTPLSILSSGSDSPILEASYNPYSCMNRYTPHSSSTSSSSSSTLSSSSYFDLVTGNKAGMIQIWDLQKEKLRTRLRAHPGPITALLSPTGGGGVEPTGGGVSGGGVRGVGLDGLVISGSVDGQVKIWDPRVSEGSGLVMKSLLHYESNLYYSITTSNSSSSSISSPSYSSLHRDSSSTSSSSSSTSSRQPLAKSSVTNNSSSSSFNTRSTSTSTSGSRLGLERSKGSTSFSGSTSRSGVSASSSSSSSTPSSPSSGMAVSCLAVSYDDSSRGGSGFDERFPSPSLSPSLSLSRVISGGADGSIIVLDVRMSFRVAHRWTHHRSGVTSLCLTRDLLSDSDPDHSVNIEGVGEGGDRGGGRGGGGGRNRIGIGIGKESEGLTRTHHDGMCVFSGDASGMIHCYDLLTGELKYGLGNGSGIGSGSGGGGVGVCALYCDPIRKVLVSGGGDGKCVIYRYS